jgi:hypothetical protein
MQLLERNQSNNDQLFDWYCCGTSLELSIDTRSSLSLFSSSLLSDLRGNNRTQVKPVLIQGNIKV